jgi:hypothetical protein
VYPEKIIKKQTVQLSLPTRQLSLLLVYLRKSNLSYPQRNQDNPKENTLVIVGMHPPVASSSTTERFNQSSLSKAFRCVLLPHTNKTKVSIFQGPIQFSRSIPTLTIKASSCHL